MSEFNSTNPNLLNPAFGQDQKFVPPLTARTDALPYIKADRKYYFVCTQPNHKMNRTDGKLLPFRNGFLATDDSHDIYYITGEIGTGNPYVRAATEEEIRLYNMTVDPSGTVRAEMQPVMEAEIRQSLEIELAAIIEARMNDIGLTDEQKQKLTAPMYEQEFVPPQSANPIEGVDAMSKLRGMNKTTDGGTTVFTPQLSGVGNFASSISGTDKMANAAESNSP